MNIEIEHYVTLHDTRFLPIALTMYRSLIHQQPTAHLTVVCMDTESYDAYQRLQLPNLTAVSPESWLNDKLAAIKATRSPREFCWTMASHSYDIAWDQHPCATRLTYLDADLYFFDSPSPLIAEMLEANKQVLITEHAYDPKYDQSKTAGIYCVQFVTFSNSRHSLDLLRRWQSLCEANCSEIKDGLTFGDQKYLDTWAQEHPGVVHVSRMRDKTLAPWNIDFFAKSGSAKPIFFHFHTLRIVSSNRVLAWENYRIGSVGRKLYAAYLNELAMSLENLKHINHSADYFLITGSLRLRTSTAIRSYFNLPGQRTYMSIKMHHSGSPFVIPKIDVACRCWAL